VTQLRQMMLDELQRRNYSQSTTRSYIHAVENFARYFHRSPERLGPEHIRRYQAYLFRERKLSPGTYGCVLVCRSYEFSCPLIPVRLVAIHRSYCHLGRDIS